MSPNFKPNCYGFATRCRKLYFPFYGAAGLKRLGGNRCTKQLNSLDFYKNQLTLTKDSLCCYHHNIP